MADRKDLQVRPFDAARFQATMKRIVKLRGIRLPAERDDDMPQVPWGGCRGRGGFQAAATTDKEHKEIAAVRVTAR